MAATTTTGTTRVRVRQYDGSTTEVAVSPELADALKRLNGNGKKKRWRREKNGELSFTDAGIVAETIVAPHKSPTAATGHPWEGPKYSFTVFLGESSLWQGQTAQWLVKEGDTWVPATKPSKGRTRRCRFCGHLPRLGLEMCCLNAECSNTGRDLAIPKGEPRNVTRYDPDPTLKGGKG